MTRSGSRSELRAGLGLLRLDRQLARACEQLRLLRYITPLNGREVRERFLAGEVCDTPEFSYREVRLDVAGIVERLEALADDASLAGIGHDEGHDEGHDGDGSQIAAALDRKRLELIALARLLQARGTPEFRARSRELYGTPTPRTLHALKEWLALAPDPPEAKPLNAYEARRYVRQCMAQSGLVAAVNVREWLTANAAAGESSIGLRRRSQFSRRDLDRLHVHEVETHLLRARNGERQPFRSLFVYGFPRAPGEPHNYLALEEGLATFHEERSGVLTRDRQRVIAARTHAVALMDQQELTFGETFRTLVREHGFAPAEAYGITERVYRGGGFTKDHIYLEGYVAIRALWERGYDFTTLYLGKVGFGWLDLVDELAREPDGVLFRPRYLPDWFELHRAALAPDGEEDDDEGDDEPVEVDAAMLEEDDIGKPQQAPGAGESPKRRPRPRTRNWERAV